jgi:integrase
MTKRAHGAGSISRLPSGNWRALVSVDGRRVSQTFRTKKEADDWIKQTSTQVEQGLSYDSMRTTFSQVLNEWLEIKATKLRPASMQQYKDLVERYINPSLGMVVIKDLNAARIQAFYSHLQGKTGKRTIEIIHTIMHGCLDHARRLGLVSQNWAQLVEVPRPSKKEMKVWDESQVSQFLINAPDNTFYRLAFATGMRRGELIGLKLDDIDWQNETIMVRRQVFEPRGGGFRFQEPKTDRGRRKIRLGPGLIQALKNLYNHELPIMRELAGNRWQEFNLIFPSTVGTPRGGNRVTKAFRRHIKQAGLPVIRFHDMRHTAASIMLLHGEPPVRVAGILGQSVMVLLDTYAHYIPDDQSRAAKLMDDITSPVAIDIGINQSLPIAHELHTD